MFYDCKRDSANNEHFVSPILGLMIDWMNLRSSALLQWFSIKLRLIYWVLWSRHVIASNIAFHTLFFWSYLIYDHFLILFFFLTYLFDWKKIYLYMSKLVKSMFDNSCWLENYIPGYLKHATYLLPIFK